MSPSLVLSDSHCRGSNTASPSSSGSPNHPRDISPMATSSFFQSAVGTSFEDILSQYRELPLCTTAKLSPNWAAFDEFPASERVPSISVSVSGEPVASSGIGAVAFYSNLAAPVPKYGGVGSPLNFSPSSSISSGNSPHGFRQSERPSSWSRYDAFVSTCSRVVMVRKGPNASFSSLVSMFELFNNQETHTGHRTAGLPLSMWTMKELSDPDEAWVVFESHHDACAFLLFSFPSYANFPALEIDLERLQRANLVSRSPTVQFRNRSHQLRMSLSTPDLQNRTHAGQSSFAMQPLTQTDDFVLSSNPPNPRTTFRLGDWICSSPTCAAHNFGRNLACRGCGCPRSESQIPPMNRQAPFGVSLTRLPASPRFAGGANAVPFHQASPVPSPFTTSLHPNVPHGARHSSSAQPGVGIKPASPSHPVLTPSGRSFSVGGKVQNISSDPLTPCIMYWPDNEPFPEQGQIRPSNLSGVPQPPILNTGNRGPIEHQPGDWICLTCNYLNWRRRKVCQTCYPYAEGNGDSISAAVQAERINLLTSLLTQNQIPLGGPSASPANVSRQQSMPSLQRQPLQEATPPSSRISQRSRCQFDSTVQYPDSQFIYETSGPQSSPSFPSMGDLDGALPISAPAPLLPSFLQDIVQSPSLSPTSTSSADLSIEEYDDIMPSRRLSPTRDRVMGNNDSSSHLPLSNIWKLNDEETKGIAGIALPHLIGNKQEILRS
ncbi:hypothetical protein PAXRUDRAFT_830145 [Paxillus rubicundulus Ve08.2h10]|uniref:RanBP2-type domain-containing protein n=1 Tax=Paxillus rubicundulus Ve08.2h10 TaxID=930991 RepID=A0A0D0DTX8_9AGAM|nr:hypothetical protein PAXRUDRAFT_830145 [Paxillus rubicundulus Ve08.2h10]